MDVNSLKNLRYRLITRNKELRKVNVEIEPYIGDADLEADYVAVADYEDRVAKAFGDVRSKIARLRATTTTAHAGADGDRDQPSQATGVKLPKLQILRYQGELTQWQHFWEQFDAAVHCNTGSLKARNFGTHALY